MPANHIGRRLPAGDTLRILNIKLSESKSPAPISRHVARFRRERVQSTRVKIRRLVAPNPPVFDFDVVDEAVD